MDPEECKLLIFENVCRFYASLNLNVNEHIPILLVDKDEMSKFEKTVPKVYVTTIHAR